VSDPARCPSCGALVAGDAEWCGQCYRSLRAPADRDGEGQPAPSPQGAGDAVVTTPGGGAVAVAGGRATWTCPGCASTNDLAAMVCAVCGTPFARLFERSRPAAVATPPARAALWSVAFPGLGHWVVGRRADGVARAVVFTWSFATLVILIASRSGKAGLGPTLPLVMLFGIASVAVYAVSIADAWRLAVGDDPLVSSKVLLWVAVALVVLSGLLATFATLPAVRG
jgi:hypothetical protein